MLGNFQTVAIKTILTTILALMGAGFLAGCSSSEQPPIETTTPVTPPTSLEGAGLSIAVYTFDGSSSDILLTGTVVDLGAGCIGVRGENLADPTVLAVPVDSSMSEDGLITAKETFDGQNLQISFRVGDEIRFTGSKRSAGEADYTPISNPEVCPSNSDIWLLLPLS